MNGKNSKKIRKLVKENMAINANHTVQAVRALIEQSGFFTRVKFAWKVLWKTF